MKTLKNILSLLMALAVICTLPLSAFAAPFDDAVIDFTKSASVNIYKYDLTGAEKDGIWDSSYVSTGVRDESGVEAILGNPSRVSSLNANGTAYGYAVPGVEFTTADNGIELHILGLFINPETHYTINSYIDKAATLKEESNYRLVKRLQEHGYDITYVEILENSKGHVNRANIAAELVKKGYIESIDWAFKNILHKDYGLYEPPERLSSIETIRFIREIGAVAVWAHPYFHMTFDQAEEFLPRAVAAGLQGMETIYSTYDDATTEKAKEVCRRFGICESGGSDFHGANKPKISLGKGFGNLRIPYEFYERLKSLKNT